MNFSFLHKMMERPRLFTQCLFSAVINGYWYGFFTGRIYTGPAKALCVPGLNCYSCPGALGSCPIGSLQAVLASRNYRFSCYVVGFFLLFGSLFGRLICGWLCPFGLVQDLFYRIPLPGWLKKRISKRKNLPAHKILVWVKYLILVGFVILLPLFALDMIGQGSPWFCKYLCPSGTLGAGIPLLLTNEPLRQAAGFLFQWKFAILLFLLILSLLVYRPFCKYLCPLGAIYSFFNPIALYRYQVQDHACVKCGKCQKSCKMDIRVWENPNHPECIRCGDCVSTCPTGAIQKVPLTAKKDSGTSTSFK